MKDFEEYKMQHSKLLNQWTERAQRIIYLCDEAADLNPEWVSSKLNNNEHIQIYRTAISRMRCKRELSEQQQFVLKEFKQKLYEECSSLIAEYCIN